MSTAARSTSARWSFARPGQGSVESSAGHQGDQQDRRPAELVSRLPLADGLRVCLELADQGSPWFDHAALRWHSCFCSRARGIHVREAQDALTALGDLQGVERRVAGEELRELLLRYRQDEAVAILGSWLGGSGSHGPRPGAPL